MRSLVLPLAGLAALIAASVLGLVVAPVVQLGSLTPAAGVPQPLSPLAERGARLYRAEGCAECHTQQLRPLDAAGAAARGWGPRRTVPRDYLFERPPALGALRAGPDLANEGARQPAHDAAWQLRHLYAPASVSPGSIMPSYRFLFVKRPAGASPAPNALRLPPPWAPAPGEEIVPTPAAEALAAYLAALDHRGPLPEAAR